MTLCEKCGKVEGHPYPLLYGSIASASTGAGTRTNMTVAGVQDVFICDRCARDQFTRDTRGLEWIMAGCCVFLAGGLLWAGWPAIWAPIVAVAILGAGAATFVLIGRQTRRTPESEKLRDGGESAASTLARRLLPSGTMGWSPGQWVAQQVLGTQKGDREAIDAEVRALIRQLPHRTSPAAPRD